MAGHRKLWGDEKTPNSFLCTLERRERMRKEVFEAPELEVTKIVASDIVCASCPAYVCKYDSEPDCKRELNPV